MGTQVLIRESWYKAIDGSNAHRNIVRIIERNVEQRMAYP